MWVLHDIVKGEKQYLLSELDTYAIASESFIHQERGKLSVCDTTIGNGRIFLNEGIDENRPLERNGKHQLKAGDFIRIHKGDILRVEMIKFEVCYLNIEPESTDELRNQLKLLGSELVSKFHHSCTHLVTNCISLEPEFIQALVDGVQIVTPKFWAVYISSIQNHNSLPDPEKFKPIDVSCDLKIDHRLLEFNPYRKYVFRTMTFVFATEDKMKKYDQIIASCGGKCLDLEKCYIPNSLLPYYTLIKENENKKYEDILMEQGRRLIPEIEIALAVIHASTMKFCNNIMDSYSVPSISQGLLTSTKKTANLATVTNLKNVKKIKCTHCEQIFAYYTNMLRHRKNAHFSKEKEFGCYICKILCSNLYNLKVHFRRHHITSTDVPRPKPKPYIEIAENIDKSREIKNINSLSMCNCNSGLCDERCENVLSSIECTRSTCRSENCSNRKFHNLRREIRSRTIVKHVSGKKGFGLFAKKKIKKGDLIVEYLGEIINKKEYNKRLVSCGENLYFMKLPPNQFIDAMNFGNHSRFINHSCNPNASSEKWEVAEKTCVGIFAKKNIAKDEEITMNYNWNSKRKCYCGENACKSTI